MILVVSPNFSSRPFFDVPFPAMRMSKEEDWKKEQAKFPLRDEPSNPSKIQTTQKEHITWTGDSVEEP